MTMTRTKSVANKKEITRVNAIVFISGIICGSYLTLLRSQSYSPVTSDVRSAPSLHSDVAAESNNVLADMFISEDDWYSHDNVNLTPVKECTEEQRSKIQDQLGLSSGSVKLNGCFDTDWLDAFFEEVDDIGSEYFIGISVGCNVGTDAISTARMGMSDPKFDVPSWINALGRVERPFCGSKKRNQGATNFPIREGEMHCIEPMPSNAMVLNNAMKTLILDEGRFVVSHAAISSGNSVVKFPNFRAGAEGCGIQGCQNVVEQVSLVDVKVYSLDYYASKFVRGKGPINVLSVDVEGWDFDVLFGASSVLDRTYYLEFEFHLVGEFRFSLFLVHFFCSGKIHLTPLIVLLPTLPTGNWANYRLQDAVRLLDRKGKMVCQPFRNSLILFRQRLLIVPNSNLSSCCPIITFRLSQLARIHLLLAIRD
jgi:FkbM family methyltransferase